MIKKGYLKRRDIFQVAFTVRRGYLKNRLNHSTQIFIHLD